MTVQCPFSRAKQTSRHKAATSANDPERTWRITGRATTQPTWLAKLQATRCGGAIASLIMHRFIFITASLVAYSRIVNTSTIPASSCGAPTATTLNGTWSGYHNSFYNEDYFLGIPFAQPPIGNLRYAAPQSLNASWTGVKNATQYGYECVGYGVSLN